MSTTNSTDMTHGLASARPGMVPRIEPAILLAAAAALAVVLPALLVTHPAGTDWPNHLARHAIGHAIADSPILQGYYDYAPRPVANAGADILVGLLAPLTGVEAAARAVLVLTLALWVVAPLLLARALHGRWSPWPLVAAPFAWNANVAMSFENYALAAPLAICAFAAWIGVARDRRGLAVFVVLALATYLGHIIAFGLLAAMVGAWEVPGLLRGLRTRPRATALRAFGLGSLFLLPLLHFAAMLEGNLPAADRITIWGTLSSRLRAYLAPALVPQTGTLALITVTVVLALVLWLFSRGWLRIRRGMGPVLLVLFALALLAPRQTLGIAFTDIRIPPVLMLVLVAAFRFDAPRRAERASTPIPALIAAATATVLLVLTVVPIARGWMAHDARVASVREGLALLEPGAKVLRAVPTDRWSAAVPPLVHVVSYAALDRHAFVPALFTGAQFLSVRSDHAHLDHPVPRPIPLGLMDVPARASAPNDYWHGWRETFDYVLLVGALDDPALGEPDMVPPGLVAIHSGPGHTLFRIVREDAR